MPEPYRVFWQPGCSSCLKAKEFLTQHAVAFESVNVLADDDGLAALQALGAKSVPVVSQGQRFVFAQNLRDVAVFVGVDGPAKGLAVTELVAKVERILTVAQSHARQLPLKVLRKKLPGRDRTYLALSYHIFVIAQAFLEAAKGGVLTFEFFERQPSEAICDGDAVSDFGALVAVDFQAWWYSTNAGSRLPETLETYYGAQSVDDLLERTAWHMAQHTRQLAAVIESLNITLSDHLSTADLAGLPLPDHVYDDEVPLNAETR
ncbi:MAG: glutaredoxin family protein [Rhodospirillaceae bacterium]